MRRYRVILLRTVIEQGEVFVRAENAAEAARRGLLDYRWKPERWYNKIQASGPVDVKDVEVEVEENEQR